jgi:hypothetical protein
MIHTAHFVDFLQTIFNRAKNNDATPIINPNTEVTCTDFVPRLKNLSIPREWWTRISRILESDFETP